MTRQMLWRMHAAGHPMDAHRIDSQAIISRGRSADSHEGVSSFLEKRPAEFPNKVSTDMPDFFDWQAEPPFE
jgi:enoyl-CoA hydratase/carnithine racemase